MPKTLLVTGLALGVIGDAMLHPGGPPGVNLTVWVAAIALAAYGLQHRAGLVVDRERVVWLVVLVLFAVGLAWRDSTTLKPAALGCVTLGFALAAYRRDGAWVRRAGVSRYVLAWASTAAHAWTASFLVLIEAARATKSVAGGSAGWRRAAAVARGLAIATPLVVFFGFLFMSADAVFEQLVVNTVRLDVEVLASHVLLFAVCAWLATGYLRGYQDSTELPLLTLLQEGPVPELVAKRPTLGITEVATALGALNLLFLLFVIIQFRYLFGGDVLVQVTPGLTYAEYARRGFFELLAVAALALPLVVGLDWLGRRDTPRQRRVFQALGGAMVLLTLVILGSAMLRMVLYEDAYGYTHLRLYSHAFMIWLAALCLLFLAALARERRQWLTFGVLVSLLVALGGLSLLNPDHFIAEQNLRRYEVGLPLDARHLTDLSADAAPVVLRALDLAVARDDVAVRDALGRGLRQMLLRLDPAVAAPWPAANLARANAHAALAARRAEIEAYPIGRSGGLSRRLD
jgi:hypothetical protein